MFSRMLPLTKDDFSTRMTLKYSNVCKRTDKVLNLRVRFEVREEEFDLEFVMSRESKIF